MPNLVDVAKMPEKTKKKNKFIKKAAIAAKIKPKKKPLADKLKSMYGKKNG